MHARSDTTVTVIGGGLAGLIAATEVAEAGHRVDLYEARDQLGGRARSLPDPYVANYGPHALYTGTVLWTWLRDRGLQGRAPMPTNLHVTFRWKGACSRLPPRAARTLLRLRGVTAPVDQDLATWATNRWGPEAAAVMAGTAGALTFDRDPGRLSAAFVVERLQRIVLRPRPTARYVAGGWTSIVENLATHAEAAGATIHRGAPVDAAQLEELASKGPVIVAVEPRAARRLLGDSGPAADDRRAALLDVALARRRGDPYLIIDLDEAAFSTRPTAILPELAPKGCELIQLAVGMEPGEGLEHGEARLEAVLDAAMDDWRSRELWRRRAAARESTGAVDLPGTTWRDRPTTHPRTDIWLAGDWVAAPGHLAEVSANSAIDAARSAVAACGALRTVRPAARV